MVEHPGDWLPMTHAPCPHVTVSTGEGVPAKEAGEVAAEGVSGCADTFAPLAAPLELPGVVGVKLTHSSQIVTSQAELLDPIRQLGAALATDGAPAEAAGAGAGAGPAERFGEIEWEAPPAHAVSDATFRRTAADHGLAVDVLKQLAEILPHQPVQRLAKVAPSPYPPRGMTSRLTPGLMD